MFKISLDSVGDMSRLGSCGWVFYARRAAAWVAELSSIAYDPLLQKTGIKKKKKPVENCTQYWTMVELVTMY